MDIKRLYQVPSKSFFLFGPRGVGKSTWIRQRAQYALKLDLLQRDTLLKLQRNPTLLESLCAHLQPDDVVFIDEIQKLPALLDEIHRLMEDKRLNFILTGSSARKLKRVGANLLSGRAHTYKMFPFSIKELDNLFSTEELLEIGSLPIVLREPNLAEETLASYVGTYLQEEIKEEALVRRVEEFNRFLAVAGMLNGCVLNFENVARETGKSSKTVQSWYQILVETLLGTMIQPYRPGLKVRESAHTKFYWFDSGVARIAAGLEWTHLDGTWKGFAFEGIILREIQTYLEISRKRNSIFYYSTPGAGGIDFVIETRKKTISQPQEFISIEVKYSNKWRKEFESSSRSLFHKSPKSHKRMIGIYIGPDRLTFDSFEVFPLQLFIEELYAGRII
jgi:predicted AAA+ superfamily ATPase